MEVANRKRHSDKRNIHTHNEVHIFIRSPARSPFFKNTNASQGEEFWENRYLDPTGTEDDTYLTKMTNSFGIELIEGFQKWAKFGLSAYISYQTQKYKQTTFFHSPELTDTEIEQLSPLPANFHISPTSTRNMLWAGGRLQKDKGNILRYAASAKFGLVGDVVGDIELDGNLTTRFKLFGDSVKISANAEFKNQAQPYLLQNYISNHFAWNNDFGKTRRYKAGGELLIPWTKTTLSAGVENIENMVYFDALSLPRQHNGNIQVFSARLDQKFKVGILNWNNTIYYQKHQTAMCFPSLNLPSTATCFSSLLHSKCLNFR